MVSLVKLGFLFCFGIFKIKNKTKTKQFCPGEPNPPAEKTIQAQCPSHLWLPWLLAQGRGLLAVVGPWGHLARHKKVTKPGCGIAVCHGQLRDGIIRKCCSCWGLRGKHRDPAQRWRSWWMGLDDYIMWSLSKAIPANTALLMAEQRVLVLLWAGFQWNCNWENKHLQTISYILKTTLQQNCPW